MTRMLSGPELSVLHTAIEAAFDENSLPLMLRFRLDRRLGTYAGPASFRTVVYKVVDGANMEGWWPQLLIAARSSVPGNPALIEAEAKLQAKSSIGDDQGNLEKIVDLRSGFTDVDEFGKRHGRLVNAVCAIEDSRGGLGTGWLVAADVVITNYHVVRRFLNQAVGYDELQCRFDFKLVDGLVNTGRTVRLAKEWCIAYRPFGQADVTAGLLDWSTDELDYALLRLAEPVGSQPIGLKPEPLAPERGWIELRSKPQSVVANDRIWIFQHPQDLSVPSQPRLQAMKLSNGKVLEWAGNGIRLRHDARTLPGSSGSVCCDDKLEVVALHQGGDPQDWPNYRGKFNQAIPLERIVTDLIVRNQSDLKGLDPFWDKPTLSL